MESISQGDNLALSFARRHLWSSIINMSSPWAMTKISNIDICWGSRQRLGIRTRPFRFWMRHHTPSYLASLRGSVPTPQSNRPCESLPYCGIIGHVAFLRDIQIAFDKTQISLFLQRRTLRQLSPECYPTLRRRCIDDPAVRNYMMVHFDNKLPPRDSAAGEFVGSTTCFAKYVFSVLYPVRSS